MKIYKFGDISESSEVDASKYSDIARFKQKREADVKAKINTYKNLNAQYDSLVAEIRRLRQKGDHKLADRKGVQLHKMQLKKRKLKTYIPIAMAGTDSPSLPLVEYITGVLDVYKETADIGACDICKFLMQCVTMVYNLYHNPTLESLVYNISNLIVQYLPSEWIKQAVTWIQEAFTFPSIQAGSMDVVRDFIMNILNRTDDFINDMLWERVQGLWLKLVSLYIAGKTFCDYETLDFDTLWKKYNLFRTHLPQCKDLVDNCFSGFSFIMGNWENIKSGSWPKFGLGKAAAIDFETEVRVLEQAYAFVSSGQYIELNNLFKMDLDGFERSLQRVIAKGKDMIHSLTSAQQRICISNFITRLMSIQASFWQSKASAPHKLEAYALKLSGPSSCGKSTMLRVLSRILLETYGHKVNDKGQIVFTNIEERYESTIEPSHKIIIADDVANNVNSKPNYDRLLNYVNTIPRPLEKADVDKKGKFFPSNDALIVTTNDITLRATDCSICPESILRRFTLDVVVSIKPEFKNAFGGLKNLDGLDFNVYDLELRRFSHISLDNKTHKPMIHWDVLDRRNWVKHNCSDFISLCSFLREDVLNHMNRQKTKLEVQRSLEDCTTCCECKMPNIVCSCRALKDVPQAEFCNIRGALHFLSTRELWSLRSLLIGGYDQWLSISVYARVIRKLYQYYQSSCIYLFVFFLVLSTLSILQPYLVKWFLGAHFVSLVLLYAYLTHLVRSELKRRRDRFSALIDDPVRTLEQVAVRSFKMATSFYMIYRIFKMIKPLLKRKASGDLKAMDKNTFLDEKLSYFKPRLASPAKGDFVHQLQDERDYKEGYSRIPPRGTWASRTTTAENLQDLVARNLRVVVTKSRGKVYGTVNGIMVKSNILMLPSHAIPYTFPFDIETTTQPGIPTAKTKDQKLTAEYCYIDRSRDLAFVHLASSPCASDISHFFSPTVPNFYNRSTCLVWKSPENEIKISRQPCRLNQETIYYAGFLEQPGYLWGQEQRHTLLTIEKLKGFEYDTEFPGFCGLCGSLLLDRDSAMIYGFHVAGILGSKRGWSTGVLMEDILNAERTLKMTSPTLVVSSASDLRVDSYDAPYTLHNEKPLYCDERSVGSTAIASYFGKVRKDGLLLESRARTPYMRTPFKGVVEQFGEAKHCPPKDPNSVDKGLLTLNKLLLPIQNYEGDLLLRAIKDYNTPILNLLKEKKSEMRSIFRIYSLEEALDGIGEFGLHGIPNDTSTGFPLNMAKKRIFVRDPCDPSLVKIPREFTDQFDIVSEIDKTMSLWARGQRSEIVFKASSKVNELLPKEKATTKVRKFYGSPIAGYVASRRVLAAIPRFIYKEKILTECFVGLNPLSYEWDDMAKELRKFGDGRFIAGDFSSFDTRMAAQITASAAKIMLSWYEEVGADAELLNYVRGALSDIIHPNILFDSDLYRFANGNPSGNLITVQLNSICNSLMMRYVYYSMRPQFTDDFRRHISLVTYGDDNLMAVSPKIPWFTHTSCQKEFEKVDIQYTMADKSSTSRGYITLTEASFLKRGFIKHSELNCYVAPLEMDSILKRFHWVKKPTETPLNFEEQFSAYVDGALRDIFLHGHQAYIIFSEKIKAIINQNSGLETRIYVPTYDEMVHIMLPYYTRANTVMNKPTFNTDSTMLHVSDGFVYEDYIVNDYLLPVLGGKRI